MIGQILPVENGGESGVGAHLLLPLIKIDFSFSPLKARILFVSMTRSLHSPLSSMNESRCNCLYYIRICSSTQRGNKHYIYCYKIYLLYYQYCTGVEKYIMK